ncbi:hypothetical protein MIND_00682400 [Mycena indigotica]|uniref:Kinetochore protein Sos7 coiled-coil domain-containing protein n=1 Tax=Mycena indigotica TaxID=2126181 RepID=A0A8H6W6K6_9AGAR|nr:uncharacterized protein MIND_00682400 [Mycena indigotica]KAF7301179.1 hypothetical protein MIND_00682400 [Mycena indigotica]
MGKNKMGDSGSEYFGLATPGARKNLQCCGWRVENSRSLSGIEGVKHKRAGSQSHARHTTQPTTMSLSETLQTALQQAQLDLPGRVAQFNAVEVNLEKLDVKDPAVVLQDLNAQTAHLRKLKFQQLEQNAKAKYIRNIVTDIDDAAFVTEEDNKALDALAAKKKQDLSLAKKELAEGRKEYCELAPRVEAGWVHLSLDGAAPHPPSEHKRLKDAAMKAADLTQKIIDARLALARLRQAHPKPHLTIAGAEQRLTDQVEEMQVLEEEKSDAEREVAGMKRTLKNTTQEVEKLRVDRAETEKAVKASRVDEDDAQLMPLYHSHLESLKLQKSIVGLHDWEHGAENELQLNYIVEQQPISILLTYHPNTRQLANVQVSGLEERGVDVSEVVFKYTDSNDVQGLIAAVLSIARAATI